MTAAGLRELIEGNDLTDREVEVLYCRANGRTSKQTAEELFLAQDTVKEYDKRIVAKLGAKNMTHAVTLALGIGIIDISKIMDE